MEGMTASAPNPDSDLVRAAQTLADELRHCEEAVAEACKIRLNTEKNIGRAARALQKANDHREQTAAQGGVLLAAIQATHARAQEATSRMEARAAEIQARMQRIQAFQARAEEFVAAVREVTEVARGARDPREILERLQPVEDRITAELEEAKKQELDDVAHEMAGLREMLASVRRKLGGA